MVQDVTNRQVFFEFFAFDCLVFMNTKKKETTGKG